MDAFPSNAALEQGLAFASFPRRVDPVPQAPAAPGALTRQRLGEVDTLVVTKSVAGFDDACIAELRRLVADAKAGRPDWLKFLVFDFAHEGQAASPGGEAFDNLVVEVANLVLGAPVVTVAHVRGDMAGADLEFALACSMMISEDGARYAFGADPVVSIGTYSFLAQKLGFVRAERLMESDAALSAQEMRELLLLKDVSEAGAGLAGLERFLRKAVRRHNSTLGIYRAQRIAAPATGVVGRLTP